MNAFPPPSGTALLDALMDSWRRNNLIVVKLLRALDHGQIKVALKAAGRPLDDEAIGRTTWDVWMEKRTWA